MNHQEITKALVHNVCVEGVLPPDEIQRHVASCRSCLDTLASISEFIKPGSSESWYESIKKHYLCDDIEAELDLIAAKDPDELATESPFFAVHLKECVLCAERYVSAQRLLEAESEGVLGQAIKLPERKSTLWSEVKEKVFELTQAIRATLKADSSGFRPLDLSGLPGLVAAPSAAVRSQQLKQTGANDAALQEAQIELSPPTISDKLTVRLLYEAEGLVSIEFSYAGDATERLVIAIFDVGEKPSLLEARSLSSTKSVARFERLHIDDYLIEIRGPSGVSKVPISLQREEE